MAPNTSKVTSVQSVPFPLLIISWWKPSLTPGLKQFPFTQTLKEPNFVSSIFFVLLMLWHVRSWFWEDCFPQRYLVLKDSKQLLLLTHQSTQSVHLTISFSNSHTSSQYSPCTNSPQGQVLTIRDLPPRACSNYSNQPILSLLRTPTLPHPLPPTQVPTKPVAHALPVPLSASWRTLVLPPMALHLHVVSPASRDLWVQTDT